MSSNRPSTPVFFNIQVVVSRNAPGVEPPYVSTSYPARITVSTPDAVIAYQLVDPTPPDIRIIGYSLVDPDRYMPQLSAPTVSLNGRLMTLVDLNSIQAQLHLNLEFADRDGTRIIHDPQITNDPE